MLKNKFLLCICLIGLASIGYSQKGIEAGGWIGTSLYYGDLNNPINVKGPGLAGGLILRNNLNTRISLTGSINYGRIKGSDEDADNNFRRNRNLSFYSDIYDFTGVAEFNFLPYIHGSEDFFYTPYLALGFSVFRYNPKATIGNQTYTLRDHGTEGQAAGDEYGSFSAGLTFVAGWKWDISENFSINIQASYRRLNTDYLDDVSTNYPDQSTLLSQRGQIAVDLSDRSLVPGISTPGSQRGNSKDNDTYTFVGISIMKYFRRLDCPPISEPKY